MRTNQRNSFSSFNITDFVVCCSTLWITEDVIHSITVNFNNCTCYFVTISDVFKNVVPISTHPVNLILHNNSLAKGRLLTRLLWLSDLQRILPSVHRTSLLMSLHNMPGFTKSPFTCPLLLDEVTLGSCVRGDHPKAQQSNCEREKEKPQVQSQSVVISAALLIRYCSSSVVLRT